MKQIELSEQDLIVLLHALRQCLHDSCVYAPDTTDERKAVLKDRANRLFNRIEEKYLEYKKERQG